MEVLFNVAVISPVPLPTSLYVLLALPRGVYYAGASALPRVLLVIILLKAQFKLCQSCAHSPTQNSMPSIDSESVRIPSLPFCATIYIYICYHIYIYITSTNSINLKIYCNFSLNI